MDTLTDTQKTILQAAVLRLDGNIEPLPANINQGIKPRVIQGLLKRQLIDQQGKLYVINNAGREAIGEPPKPSQPEKPPTKKQQVLELIRRPQGVTLKELCQLTGWEKHTVRGTISVLNKTMAIDSSKVDGQRTYRQKTPS